MGKLLEIKNGQKFGRYTIIYETESHYQKNGNRTRVFNCLCDCGNIRNVELRTLMNGTSKSCGCLKNELSSKRIKNNPPNVKHRKTGDKTYQCWRNMKSRCYYLKNKDYDNYGGRGIKVCDRWLNSFQFFLEDMGERPENKTLDRIDPNGNYEPINCRWATPYEQTHNRRFFKRKKEVK